MNIHHDSRHDHSFRVHYLIGIRPQELSIHGRCRFFANIQQANTVAGYEIGRLEAEVDSIAVGLSDGKKLGITDTNNNYLCKLRVASKWVRKDSLPSGITTCRGAAAYLTHKAQQAYEDERQEIVSTYDWINDKVLP